MALAKLSVRRHATNNRHNRPALRLYSVAPKRKKVGAQFISSFPSSSFSPQVQSASALVMVSRVFLFAVLLLAVPPPWQDTCKSGGHVPPCRIQSAPLTVLRVWNSLPASVIGSDSLSVLKSRLKHSYFVGHLASTHNRLPPAPLKLRPYGAIQICLIAYYCLLLLLLLL